MTNKFNTLPSNEIISKTIESLQAAGIDAQVMTTGQEAKEKALSLIPEGASVFNMTSRTLDSIGVADEITKSGKYDSVRDKLMTMDRNTQHQEMNRLGAAPDYAIGSVHAVTQDGKVLIASNTGSQLAAYVYGAGKVIWVVGAQKIVKDMDEGMKRIYDYVLPLESERMRKVYPGIKGSYVSKLLIVNKEVKPGRISLIFVKEVLGF